MGARANCAVLSATRRRAATADAKNTEIALPENGGSAKNGEASWGAMARERRGENAQNGGVLGYRKVVRNCSRAVGEKRRAEGLRRGREFTMKPGERQKNPRSHERTGRKGERRCGKRRAECAVN